ncbi:hypothetical protein BofuT4_P124570.1 [Botrytis cinerea T4]|uniref:Uncharacterized protein n=1 Tax=Botryotinia fuckeliana (strain T4) TaxID=999810 RepID=G2YS11_BOTF4|nr:hypothetical protein BofuT4_P124570.1 [Botrytis cinerea T4]
MLKVTSNWYSGRGLRSSWKEPQSFHEWKPVKSVMNDDVHDGNELSISSK